MKIIGHRERFAFEIGEYQDSKHIGRRVDIWAGGVRLCVDDDNVHVGQFTSDLADMITRSYRISDFGKYLRGLSPVEMAVVVRSTREAGSPNCGIEKDSIYPHYRFLDLGPTTDNLSAFLFRDSRSFLVYSFWRDAEASGLPLTFRVVELDFEEILAVTRDTMNALLDT